mgnify:CR=1 FL=1
MPADDLTDPAPATTFAHLDATTVLPRQIAELGIYPAVDPLDSTSRMLSPLILGEEHYATARRVQILRGLISLQQLSAAEQAQDVALAREKLARARAHSGRRPEDLAAELDALPPSQRRVAAGRVRRQPERAQRVAVAHALLAPVGASEQPLLPQSGGKVRLEASRPRGKATHVTQRRLIDPFIHPPRLPTVPSPTRK